MIESAVTPPARQDGSAAPVPQQRQALRPLLFATLATLIAGFVDAVGYAHLGGLFLSFMSGNSTRLGISLVSGAWMAALHGLIVIGCFVAGAVTGTLIADGWPRRKLVLILTAEVVLFGLALGLTRLDGGFIALLPVAVAMGAQNAVHQVILGADVGKSFVTGALFGMGQSIARRLSGRGSLSAAFSYAMSWGAFVAGAGIGTVLLVREGLDTAIGAAALLLALLTGLAFVFDRHLGPAVAAYGGD